MIKAWTIAIPKEDSNEPAIYYNGVNQKWVQDFQGGCCFFNEKSAKETLETLNVMGAKVFEGGVE